MLRRTILAVFLGPTGASLALCSVLEELRVTAIYSKHLVTILDEILPTLPNATSLLRIILDAEWGFSEDDAADKATWNSLDAVMAEYAEKRSGKDKDRRLTLIFRTDEEGATGEHDKWARELASLLVLFPKVGKVEYISKR